MGADVLVSPAPSSVVVPVRAATERLAARTHRPTPGGDEFRGVRPWREGESPRAIHPRSSARRGAPVVREEETRGRAPWTLVVDPRGLEGEPLEEALRLAAALVRTARRDGRRCAFLLAGLAEPIDVASARDLDDALDALARHVEPSTPPPARVRAPTGLSVGHVLLVGPRAEAPAGAIAVDRPLTGGAMPRRRAVPAVPA